MYLEFKIVETTYQRNSKCGVTHTYTKNKTVLVFRCDSCGEIFYRDKGKMNPARISNNYFHCCSNCDAKRFAQRKGVERRKIWDLPASSLTDISKL